MNIQGAWQRGATGYGVTVVHIDDGMDYRHRDLRFNFDRRGMEANYMGHTINNATRHLILN